jgi:hypothetical protein
MLSHSGGQQMAFQMSDVMEKIYRSTNWHHLFLIRHKAAWSRAWDSIINSSSNDVDAVALEKEYENVVNMVNGTKVITVY